MPGIDFFRLHAVIHMADVLRLLNWTPSARRGDHQRGPCPIHRSRSARSRSLAIHGEDWYCHVCRRGGGPLQLYSLARGMRFYEAAAALCREMGVERPWLPPGSWPPGARRHREEAR
jgi:hypothetical protein